MKEKNINEIDAFKLHKKYSEEIEDLIQSYIHEKQDFFLYLKTSIKNMLETLIKFHNLEIENHNENLRFESANKWIMDNGGVGAQALRPRDLSGGSAHQAP